MMETPRRRKTVSSSLIDISTDQLGNRVVVRGEAYSAPYPFLSRLLESSVVDPGSGFGI
jgi:hypothetical protein